MVYYNIYGHDDAIQSINNSILTKSRWLLLPWIVAWAPIVPAGTSISIIGVLLVMEVVAPAG